MSTIVGVPSSYSLTEWRALGYDTEREPIGSYVYQPKGARRAQLRTIAVRHAVCPYCRGPLERLDPRAGTISGRVLAATRHDDVVHVVLDPVPAGIVVARCPACRAIFAVPATKSASRNGGRGKRSVAGSIDA